MINLLSIICLESQDRYRKNLLYKNVAKIYDSEQAQSTIEKFMSILVKLKIHRNNLYIKPVLGKNDPLKHEFRYLFKILSTSWVAQTYDCIVLPASLNTQFKNSADQRSS